MNDNIVSDGRDQNHKQRGSWSTKKREKLPRGVFRHGSGELAVRFTCGAGHIHRQLVGPLKSEAIRTYHERRNRAQREPGWCPETERQTARSAARAERERQARRQTFGRFSDDYLSWAKQRHRGYRTTLSQVFRLKTVFGSYLLDGITTSLVEQYLASIEVDGLAPATVNRYRDRLSGMFKRALRLGLIASNPVTGVEKHKEAGGRIAYLPAATPERKAYEEDALRDALPVELRDLFTVSVHTGLRWSEQINLRWRDIDMLSATITVPQSKHGYTRQVPMNSTVRSVMLEFGARRISPGDPTERVFTCSFNQAAKFFSAAVEQARKRLAKAGLDASRLEGYTWHGNRHTFASRLVMAGVDLRAVQELGGWRTLRMVQRYSHLSPEHLRDAVERLVTRVAQPDSELARN